MRLMPLAEALRLPVIQGRAYVAGSIVADPMVDAEMREGYIAQEVKHRVAIKMQELEAEMLKDQTTD